jgi:hypothetical protein
MASAMNDREEDDPRARGIVRRTTAEWMQTNVAQPNGMTQPVFREEVGFVSEEENQQRLLERRQIWSEALVEAQQLAVVIADVQKKLCKHDPSFRPIDPQKFTFAELMNAMENGRHKYEHEDLKGAKGFLRRGFRKMGENAASFRLWLELVPKGHYTFFDFKFRQLDDIVLTSCRYTIYISDSREFHHLFKHCRPHAQSTRRRLQDDDCGPRRLQRPERLSGRLRGG